MPTARPIIIEKFIDHTDSGVTAVARFSTAKPTAMPARANNSGNPAAIAEPNATRSRMIVGRPETSSARCNASSLVSLKSAHPATPLSPLRSPPLGAAPPRRGR